MLPSCRLALNRIMKGRDGEKPQRLCGHPLSGSAGREI